MKQNVFRKPFFGVLFGEFLAFVGFFVFLALFYYVTQRLSREGHKNLNDWLFNPINFFHDAGLDYTLKFFLTLPIWYLLFKKLKDWSLPKRLTLHLFLLPIFVYTWQQIYYFASESLGFYHLQGVEEVWDIYIPSLFYILLFGILHSYNYYCENKRKIILESELRNAALKGELSAIKAQLNPHFLYNIFNTISASVPAENEKTRHMIAELSDLFRYQLKASQTELVPLNEELEFVKKYLDLEKERFLERLEVYIDVDNDILEYMIPPMLLQPLIENSVKHGLSSLIDGGKIYVSIHKKNDKLLFEISDSGIGIKDKTEVFERGIGLNNTRLRLEKMYQSTLILSDNNPQGLKISFEI